MHAREGWRVVAGAFTVMFFTFGLTYGFAPFIASLQAEFAASRGMVSTAFSIAVPLYFLLGAVSGPLADRYGPRRIGLLGIIIGGAGVLAAARAEAWWQVQWGFGLGAGIAVGFSYVPVIGAVQGWFSARRGTASGIAVSGIGLGTLCMPPTAAYLIDAFGWRTAWVVLGLLMAGASGCALMLVRKAPLAAASAVDKAGGLREVVRSRTFVMLYLAMAFISLGAFIPFVHLVPYAEDQGLSRTSAVWVFSTLGLGSTLGRFLGGGVADRVGRRKALAVVFAILAAMLLWWMCSRSAWQLCLFAFVFGAAYGSFVALFPALTVDYYGTRHSLGTIGMLYTAMSVGTLAGPRLAGDAFDRFGSYDLPIAASAAFAVAAAVLVARMPEPAGAAPQRA